jgi:hypothetical protein
MKKSKNKEYKKMKKVLTIAIALLLSLTFAIGVAAEEITDDINEDVTVTEEEKTGIIETLTSSSLWASLGGTLVMVLGVFAYVGKHFKGLSLKVDGKVDTATLKAEIKEKASETNSMLQAEVNELKEQLATMQGNEKMLVTAITLFIMNMKFDGVAKAKITELLTGFVDVANLSIKDVCESVNKAIEEAKANEEKQSTPALDSIIAEGEIALG